MVKKAQQWMLLMVSFFSIYKCDATTMLWNILCTRSSNYSNSDCCFCLLAPQSVWLLFLSSLLSSCVFIYMIDLPSNWQSYFISVIRRAQRTEPYWLRYIVWHFFIYGVYFGFYSHRYTVVSLSCARLSSSRLWGRGSRWLKNKQVVKILQLLYSAMRQMVVSWFWFARSSSLCSTKYLKFVQAMNDLLFSWNVFVRKIFARSSNIV